MAFEKITEQDSNHNDLEKKSITELVRGMQHEDEIAVAAVAEVSSEIESLIGQVVAAFQKEVASSMWVLERVVDWAYWMPLSVLLPLAPLLVR